VSIGYCNRRREQAWTVAVTVLSLIVQGTSQIRGAGVAPVSTTLGRFRSQAGESEVQVPRTRPPYPEEFRREAIRLALLGDKPQRQLAKDLGISDVTLRNWLKQERAERGERPGGLSQDEREELQRLRDENARLRMEREILSKAAVFFAKESDGR
jgi:transposase